MLRIFFVKRAITVEEHGFFVGHFRIGVDTAKPCRKIKGPERAGGEFSPVRQCWVELSHPLESRRDDTNEPFLFAELDPLRL